MTKNITVGRVLSISAKILICGIISIIMIYPLWWMFTGAFKTMGELIQNPPTFFPIHPTLENIKIILGKSSIMGRMYLNSIVVSVAIPILQTVICLPAAYAFAKLKFPGNKIIFLVFLSAMMLPGQLTIITNYLTMVKLKLLNNLMSLLLLGVFSAFCIFMIKQYFMSLPKDLDDAAKIDGCSIVGVFLRIGIPLAMPIISVNLILCFNAAWGDFFTPMIFLRKIEAMTLPIGMTVLQGAYNTQSRAVVVAALAMSIVPVIIVFFVFRKKLIAGIATSGLKM